MSEITSRKNNFGIALSLSILIMMVAAMVIILINQGAFDFNLFPEDSRRFMYAEPITVIEDFTSAQNIVDKSKYVLEDSNADMELRAIIPVPIGGDKLIEQKIEIFENEEEKIKEEEELEEITIQQEIDYLYHFHGKNQKIKRINTYDLKIVEDNWYITDFVSEIEEIEK